MSVSISSRSGADPFTTPAPAKRVVPFLFIKPDLNATRNSPAPEMSNQPIGPANHPLSKLSYFNLSSFALLRGCPLTAGVGDDHMYHIDSACVDGLLKGI